jgi:hypothetical protein
VYYQNPDPYQAHVIICYRNFLAKLPECSHVGLGVNGWHTAKCLRAAKIRCDLVAVWNLADIQKACQANPSCTQVVIEAIFLSAAQMHLLCCQYPHIHFVCRCHSQVGFLQVEAGAIAILRDYLHLEESTLNFSVAVNSPRLGTFLQHAYRSESILLPNLYWEERVKQKAYRTPSKLIRVGSFGAIRLQKNHSTAAAAALILANQHGFDLEFYLSVNREENGKGVIQAIRNLYAGVPYAKLIEVAWAQWSQFRQTVALLDLHIQVSVTETFNIASADAVAEGVPSVISEAIDWAPEKWVAEIDDANDVATKGYSLMMDPHAGVRGLASLTAFNRGSLAIWMDWLAGRPNREWWSLVK